MSVGNEDCNVCSERRLQCLFGTGLDQGRAGPQRHCRGGRFLRRCGGRLGEDCAPGEPAGWVELEEELPLVDQPHLPQPPAARPARPRRGPAVNRPAAGRRGGAGGQVEGGAAGRTGWVLVDPLAEAARVEDVPARQLRNTQPTAPKEMMLPCLTYLHVISLVPR